ncbi:BTAD domain-containing putative transcriptional regulator [Nonomuraea jiangxiensis]|uniref:Predicted ATPase n=1 Tax=Nonomuraea jiangxiensis TaxID=633440 RepID=A0A1G9TNM3_9ACTN|nr:BTAD domain-containing putative transcriptional regulator [Nonomuraea jiangxiensis]SDM49242.1 Predicted ATPase [Nonomuraea jiangxiensis]
MRFRVLGPLEVSTDDGTPVKVPEVKVRLLLADLLSHDGRSVPVDRLVEDLWGAAPPRDPAAVLRTKVAQLRRALESAERGGRDLVVWQPPGYALRVEADAVDARRFGVLTGRARAVADPAVRAVLLADALALWRGEAYADFAGETFLQGTITRLGEQRLSAMEEHAEVELALGRHEHLLGDLAERVRRHPLRERFRTAYMQALYRSGRQNEALETYHDLRERLAGELGLDPSPESAALYQAILRQDTGLGVARLRGNLPVPVTELIGREAAVARLERLLSANRLVTLTGAGGVGKTRLAVAAADRLARSFADGVWLVELAALDHPARAGARATPADVATLIAAALGLADATVPGPRGHPAPIVERVAAAVRERRMLLVLDNCEHVVEPAAEVAARLLAGAPGLRLLATSREPLGIAGEHLQVVAPLEVPAAGADPALVARADAVRLFVARAAAAAGELVLDARTAEAVGVICRRLDGIPLALELAAARVRSLGVAEVARRLDARFRLLTGGRRDAPARQRTLRAVIDWSWELLAGPERVVLCRLALHPDGCTLDAAESVCATSGVPRDDVADLLAGLVDRSLVAVTGDRYRLADSVAAYCVERLAESGELATARRRHHDHYAGLAERAGSLLRGPGQRRWLRLLDAETANLRGVFDDAVRAGDGPLVRRLATALSWYWLLRGRLEEAHRAFTRVLSLGAGDPGSAAWCSALALITGQAIGGGRAPATGHGLLATELGEIDDPRAGWILGSSLFGVGDLPGSERLTRRALAAFEARGDVWGTAAALNTLAWHATARGAIAAAERDAERSLAAFTELGDAWGQMMALESLAGAAEATGRYERAASLFRRSLGIAEQLGFGIEIPFKLCGLAEVHLATGEHHTAERLYERARRLAAEQSVRSAETYALIGLARIARLTDRLDIAEAHLGVVLEWHREHGHEPNVGAAALTELGLLAHRRGDAGQARARHEEACRISRDGGDPRTVARALEGLAGTLALMGEHVPAARLLGTAAAARTSTAAAAPPLAERLAVDETTAVVRDALGPGPYAAEYERGGADYATWASGAPEGALT